MAASKFNSDKREALFLTYRSRMDWKILEQFFWGLTEFHKSMECIISQIYTLVDQNILLSELYLDTKNVHKSNPRKYSNIHFNTESFTVRQTDWAPCVSWLTPWTPSVAPWTPTSQHPFQDNIFTSPSSIFLVIYV